MSRYFSFFLLVAAMFVAIEALNLTQAVAQQTIVLVDATSTNTAAPSLSNPGSTWTGTTTRAYKYLQDGIQRALDLGPDEENKIQIWVRGAPTTGLVYYPDEGDGLTDNTRTLTFKMRDHVGIYGGFDTSESIDDIGFLERNPATNITILSGEIQQDSDISNNSFHIVTGERVRETAVIDGFTIIAGNAVGASLPVCSGIDCKPGGPPGCDYALESGEVGGGMMLVGVPTWHSCGVCQPLVVRCRFEGNQAKSGGALHFSASQGSHPLFANCSFVENVAIGQGIDVKGGGAVRLECDNVDSRSAAFVNCLFARNEATGEFSGGGAMVVTRTSGATLINCTFADNLTTNTDGAGAIFHHADCVVIPDGSVQLTNCIVAGADEPQMLGPIKTTNCRIHSLGELCEYSASINTTAGSPGFEDVPNGDYRLSSAAVACLDKGVTATIVNEGDPGDIDQDNDDADVMPDVGSLNRIVSPHNHAGGCTVDLGAFEFQPTLCPGDTDNTCVVDVDDLVAVILGWGECSALPALCPADVVPAPCGNRNVDVDDLIAVILGWGACECTGAGSGYGVNPESYADCQEVCMEFDGATWVRCMQSCLMYLCETKQMPEYCEE